MSIDHHNTVSRQHHGSVVSRRAVTALFSNEGIVLSLDLVIANGQSTDGLCSGSLSLVRDLIFLVGHIDFIVNRDKMRFSSPSID